MSSRRQFITLLGGAAAWPVAADAQQSDRVRRIGVLMGYGDDPDAKAMLSAFTQGLRELGWTEGRNLRIDIRWASGNIEQMRLFAKELVDLRPDVILAQTTPVTAALQRETRTIPIVFVIVVDPIVPASSQACRGPGAISLASSISKPRWQANGWSCSRRLRPA
jgi:putative ABC transport system substrate-binding protein